MPLNDISLGDIQSSLCGDIWSGARRTERINELEAFFRQPNVDIHFKNDRGETALRVAVSCGESKVAGMLLGKGVDANA